MACGRIRHDLLATVDLTLVIQLLKDPPDAFHESRVQCLVVVIKINPSSHTFDCLSPFTRVSHHNRSAFGVVFVDTHFQNVVSSLPNRWLG